MKKMHQIINNNDQQEDSSDNITTISDFWKQESTMQGCQSTTSSDYITNCICFDQNRQRKQQTNHSNNNSILNQSLSSSQSSNSDKKFSNNQYSILICTDFAFPKFGGVETHGYQLGQCLIERGHKVTFVTNKFQGNRCGVRYMANGMKVYNIPHLPVMNGDVAFLSFFNSLPLIRQILIREQIDIVHGHQSVSILQHIVLMTAKSMGLKTVFTEHSLFSFNDAMGIHLNKLIKWSFRDLDAAICVSHACKDNFVLRAKFNPHKTFTIPNAVDSDKFTPDPSIRQKDIEKSGNPNQINIVFISRLAYRKGVDFLYGIIPKILAEFPNVHFIIGGDGEGMAPLQQMVDRHSLQDRVELLGSLPHDKVRDVLCRGHIFLNTSLTESFCIAILEAACCGLLVVSTDVGGVPEVLPPYMAYLAKPEEKSIIRQLKRAITNVKDIPCETFYNDVASLYSWRNVAERTEKVYDFAQSAPNPSMLARLKTSLTWGSFAGLWAVMYCIMEAILLFVVETLLPAEDIDILPSFDRNTELDSGLSYYEEPQVFGDHEFRVNTLTTHSQDQSVNAQQDVVIDLYYNPENSLIKDKKIIENSQKKVGEIRRFKRTNRYTVVKPKEEVMFRPIANIQQVSETELTTSEQNATTEVTSSDEALSSDSSSLAESDVATSAGERKQKVSRKHKNRLHKRDVDGPRYCYACSSRLQAYECGLSFYQSQREFEGNTMLQSFQQLSVDTQHRNKKLHKVNVNKLRQEEMKQTQLSESSLQGVSQFQDQIMEGLNYASSPKQDHNLNDTIIAPHSDYGPPQRLLEVHPRSETPPRLRKVRLSENPESPCTPPQIKMNYYSKTPYYHTSLTSPESGTTTDSQNDQSTSLQSVQYQEPQQFIIDNDQKTSYPSQNSSPKTYEKGLPEVRIFNVTDSLDDSNIIMEPPKNHQSSLSNPMPSLAFSHDSQMQVE